MFLSVEDSLESLALVAFVGRESITTNHDVFLRISTEINISTKTSIHFLISFIHQGSKPVQVCSCIKGIETVSQRQMVLVNVTTT